MSQQATGLSNRFEGRLFSDEERLYFVLDVDTESGVARVSCRAEDGPKVIQMPVAEVGRRLSTSSNPCLDGLSSSDPSGRILKQAGGWFFTTREGMKGPYLSDTEANVALKKHIEAAHRSRSSSD